MFNNFLLAIALGVNSNVVPNHYSTNSSFKSFENLNEINQLNFNIDGVKITNESGLPDSIHQQFLDIYKNRGITNPGSTKKKYGEILSSPKETKQLAFFEIKEIEIDQDKIVDILKYSDAHYEIYQWWKFSLNNWIKGKEDNSFCIGTGETKMCGTTFQSEVKRQAPFKPSPDLAPAFKSPTYNRKGMFMLGTVSNELDNGQSNKSLTMALICSPKDSKYYASGHALITKGLKFDSLRAQMPLHIPYERYSGNYAKPFVKAAKNYLFNKMTTQAGCPLEDWKSERQDSIKSWLAL